MTKKGEIAPVLYRFKFRGYWKLRRFAEMADLSVEPKIITKTIKTIPFQAAFNATDGNRRTLGNSVINLLIIC